MTIWREASANPPQNRALVPPVAVSDLPQTHTTLAKVLRQAGYFNAHVGKWHLGDAANYPEAHGFDVNIGGSLWGAPQTYFDPYTGDKRYGGEFRYMPGLAFGRKGEYLPDRLTREAMGVLHQAAV